MIGEHEDKLTAAVREFEEEIGYKPGWTLLALGAIKQKGGKVVYAWAVEGDLPGDHRLNSNYFAMKWTGHPIQVACSSFPRLTGRSFSTRSQP